MVINSVEFRESHLKGFLKTESMAESVVDMSSSDSSINSSDISISRFVDQGSSFSSPVSSFSISNLSTSSSQSMLASPYSNQVIITILYLVEISTGDLLEKYTRRCFLIESKKITMPSNYKEIP